MDMDGVLWRANEPICDLSALFNNFNDYGIKVVLASNNATSTTKEFLNKLHSMGAKLDEWQIVSSAMAMVFLLKENFLSEGPIFIVGSPSLIAHLQMNGFFHSKENPLAVIVGMDRNFSYRKLKMAADFVRQGLPFFGTNPDLTYPTPDGLAPGAGACIAAVEAASGRKAVMAGKPNPYLFEVALERLGTVPEKTLVVGDRLETDILGGHRVGCKTLLVLSGVAHLSDLDKWSPKPDLVLNNIGELFSK